MCRLCGLHLCFVSELSQRFNDPELLRRALTPAWNQRLEFLGDVVIGWAIKQTLFERYPRLREGDLTKLYCHLSCNARLAEISQRLGLTTHQFMGSKRTPRNQQKASADLLEAVIGAIYVDLGATITQSYILHILLHDLAALAECDLRPPMEILTTALRKESGNSKIDAEILGVHITTDADPIIRVGIKLDGHIIGQAEGRTFKEAKRNAALATLQTHFPHLYARTRPSYG